MNELWRRLRALFRRSRFDRELEEEMQAHLEMKALELGDACGARREFGNPVLLREASREAWGWSWLERLGQDLRYALRMFRRSPGFTAAAVVTLALGIGANTSIFTFVNAILLRPLPVREPDRLVSVYHRDVKRGGLSSSSYADFSYYRQHSGVFTGMLAYLRVPMTVRSAGLTEKISGELVNADYFSVLGLEPALGRTFSADEGRVEGADPVVVLSHGWWKRRFGGDPGVLGRSITIGRHAFTVIGVMPPGFRGLVLDWGEAPEFWAPVTMYRQAVPALAGIDVLNNWGMHSFLIMGRLRDGVTFEQAQAEMTRLAFLATPNRHGREWTADLFPAQQARFWPAHRSSVVRFLAVLAAVAGLVLLIACLNLANLMLARALARQEEMAVRMSLGAGRGRLIRQLMTESLLLAVLGGAAGLGVAAWTTAFLAGFHDPFRIPLSVDTGLDAPVLAFAALISALSGVLAGIIPARQASRASLAGALRAQTRSCALGGLAMRNGLIVAQVALSVVLLAGAGLFLRTLRNARAEDVTLAPANVLLARLELVTFGYGEARCKLFYRQVLDRVQALPGVRNAALVFIVPLGGTRGGADIVITPPESPSERRRVQVDYNVVSPGYFQTVGLPLLRGRDFTGRDREGAPAVAIVNEQLARRFWPGEDPLGKRFGLTWKGGGEAEVVGVVRDGRFRNYRDVMRPCFYVPWFQVEPREMTLQVRTTGDPMRAAAAVRAEVRALDKDLALPEMLTLESHREMGLSQERLTAALLSGLGVLALALAAVGIHGVMSFAVTRRTREIGIRMALGAHGGQVLRMIVARGLTLVLAGLGIGLGVALALTRLTASLLHGVSPTDPPTFAAAGLLLAGVAVVACYLPALRAASVDPAVTLRHE